MKKIITLAILSLALNHYGQTINLDTNFGANGIKTISVDTEIDQFKFFDFDDNSFLMYSKIYYPNNTIENLIYKLNTDGSIDTSFGTNGKLILPNYSGGFYIHKQNNSFLVAFVLIDGQSTPQKAILRYNLNGTIDSSFGSNGELRIDNINGTSSYDYLIVLNDNSILVSDYQRFIKYTSDGFVDNTYGTNGVVNVANIGNMIKSFEGNLFFYNSLNIEKMDYNGNFINSFGTNGSYSFPAQNDYLFKAKSSKTSFMELGDLPLKFYDLNSNGTLNTNFNSNGSIDLTSDNNTLQYYDDFVFNNGVFYFVGISLNENPFIVCYDQMGNLINLNNLESYKELLISSSSAQSIMIKDNEIYVSGDNFNTTTSEWNFYVAKYNSSTLSTGQFGSKNKITYQNPVGTELKINSKDKIDNIEVYNLMGQKVIFSNSNLVNTSYLEKGIYLATIKFENDKQQTIKILKK